MTGRQSLRDHRPVAHQCPLETAHLPGGAIAMHAETGSLPVLSTDRLNGGLQLGDDGDEEIAVGGDQITLSIHSLYMT